MNRNLCGAIGLSLMFSTIALAQGTGIRLRQIATGPGSLTVVASAPGDSSRLFVGRMTGVVLVLDLNTNTFLPTPFVTLPDGASINGLLNVVFDPRWRQNGYFYASKQSTGGVVNVYRGRVSSTDPNVADPASITKVFSRYSATGQHTGGMLHFGPDGYLYLTSGDQSGNPQLLTTWGGKVFRIDVDGPDNIPGNEDDDAFPADANNNYSIPADNPYVAVAGALPEIWATGLRNPYRATMDPETGTTWIADVGSAMWEEVSLMRPVTPALNFGWPTFEGNRCATLQATCDALSAVDPILDYPHTGAALFNGVAIIGGVVYRGNAMPQFRGTYFFADNSQTWIGTMRESNGNRFGLINRRLQMNPSNISSFSCFTLGGSGEIYACTYSGNRVLVIEPSVKRDCNNNGVDDGFEGLPVCLADFDGNCGVDINDLLDFLGAFEAGSLSADYDDGSGLGLVDGAVAIEDLLMYLTKFEAGC